MMGIKQPIGEDKIMYDAQKGNNKAYNDGESEDDE